MSLNLGRQALSLAAINGFLAVALGAFAAHRLEARLSQDMLAVFDTGVQYHMFHVVAFIAVAVLSAIHDSAKLKYCIWLFLAGTFLFSGSLYVLAITEISTMGMITPIGGLAFLAGWFLLFLETIRRHV